MRNQEVLFFSQFLKKAYWIITQTQVSCCCFACLCDARIPRLELLLALHMPFLAAEGRLDCNKNWPYLTNVQLLEGDEQPRCTALLPGLL